MYKGGIIGDRTSQKKFLSSIAENTNVFGAIPVDKRWTCFYVILVLAANSGFHTPDDIIIITIIIIAAIITIIITQVPTLASMRE